MGAWSTEIECNDSYLDARDTFRALVKDGKDIRIAAFETLVEFTGYNDFTTVQTLIALADETTSAGKPERKIIERAIDLIENGTDAKGYTNRAERDSVTSKWVARMKQVLRKLGGNN